MDVVAEPAPRTLHIAGWDVPTWATEHVVDGSTSGEVVVAWSRHVPNQISTDIWIERCDTLDLDATNGTVHLHKGETVLHLADDFQVPIGEISRIAEILIELAATADAAGLVGDPAVRPA
jgi:hypothetical protein